MSGEPEGDTAGRARRGRDPEVAFPLAIVSTALGLVGLTVPAFAWVATVLGVVAYILNVPHAPTRTFAIVGTAFGMVGIGASFIG